MALAVVWALPSWLQLWSHCGWEVISGKVPNHSMCVFMIQSLGVVVSASLLPFKITYWVSRRVWVWMCGHVCMQVRGQLVWMILFSHHISPGDPRPQAWWLHLYPQTHLISFLQFIFITFIVCVSLGLQAWWHDPFKCWAISLAPCCYGFFFFLLQTQAWFEFSVLHHCLKCWDCR